MKAPIPEVLSGDDREQLHGFLHRSTANVWPLTRAHVLLKAGEGWTDAEKASGNQ
jgi:hypothetical protein